MGILPRQKHFIVRLVEIAQGQNTSTRPDGREKRVGDRQDDPTVPKLGSRRITMTYDDVIFIKRSSSLTNTTLITFRKYSSPSFLSWNFSELQRKANNSSPKTADTIRVFQTATQTHTTQ